jgi:predicted DNA-binding transcriptional regulator AlpA
MANILRKGAAAQKLGVSRSVFDEHYVERKGCDPIVPGTRKVPRLRRVKLGARAIGFFDDELDALVEALRAERDAKPAKPVTGALPATT